MPRQQDEEAGKLLSQIRKESDFRFGRDPFIGGFSLLVEQPETDVSRYRARWTS